MLSEEIIDNLVDALTACIQDNDTNTFSDFAQSDGTVIDSNGDTIPEGAWYGTDTDGEIVCFDKASAFTATTDGTAVNGEYVVGDLVVTIPNFGNIVIPQDSIDTFSDLQLSDGTIVDSSGVTVPEGSWYIVDTDNEIACLAKTTAFVADASGEALNGSYEVGDTVIVVPSYGPLIISPPSISNSQISLSVAGDTDYLGNDIPVGSPIITDSISGDIYCIAKGDIDIPTTSGTYVDANGETQTHNAGDRLITLDNGETFCVQAKQSDPFFGPGEVLPDGAPEIELSNGDVIGGDTGINTVPAGEQVVYTEATGEIYCISKPKPEEFQRCNGEAVNPETDIVHTNLDGSLYLPYGRGANGNNTNVFRADCVPPTPPCPSQPCRTDYNGIGWLWNPAQGRWNAISTTACPLDHWETSSTITLNDAALQEFQDSGDAQISLGSIEICYTNEDCMQHIFRHGQLRWIFAGRMASGFAVSQQTTVSVVDAGSPQAPVTTALWNGNPIIRNGVNSCMTAAAGCNTEFGQMFNQWQGNPSRYLVNPDEEICVRTELFGRLTENYVSVESNAVNGNSLSIGFDSQRNDAVLCDTPVIVADGFQFGAGL